MCCLWLPGFTELTQHAAFTLSWTHVCFWKCGNGKCWWKWHVYMLLFWKISVNVVLRLTQSTVRKKLLDQIPRLFHPNNWHLSLYFPNNFRTWLRSTSYEPRLFLLRYDGYGDHRMQCTMHYNCFKYTHRTARRHFSRRISLQHFHMTSECL